LPKKKRKKRFLPRILKWIGTALFVLVILSVLQVALLRFINPPFTVMSAWERIRNMGSGKEVASIKEWRPLNEIAPHIRKAILAGEDQRFLSHNGFDFTEINEAMRDMVSRKGFRGASTISMQTARTVFLWPARSLWRKILEVYYTVLVEIFWTKERILEIYLNTVDWGKGIMGVEAASRTYFHISSARVSQRQAALLAAILPSPHRWSPTNPSPYVLKKQRRILRDIKKMPLVSARN